MWPSLLLLLLLLERSDGGGELGFASLMNKLDSPHLNAGLSVKI